MGLYQIFSYNVEIQYKSYLLSNAMLFTVTTSVLNIILPFIIAYRSRGFWLNSYNFYEQPMVQTTFDYLLVAETEDPSVSIICGNSNMANSDEQCSEIQIQEFDYNNDAINDVISIKVKIDVPEKHTFLSVILIVALDFNLMKVCPLQMQTLAVISKEFSMPASGMKYHGNLEFYQMSHLPCLRHHIDTKYNASLLSNINDKMDNMIDLLLESYFAREVVTQVKPMFIRSQHGHTGEMDIELILKISEVQVLYVPSLLQEIKWAWPQYLSFVIVFFWIFKKIKKFVFSNRLVMAWELIPWRKINNE